MGIFVLLRQHQQIKCIHSSPSPNCTKGEDGKTSTAYQPDPDTAQRQTRSYIHISSPPCQEKICVLLSVLKLNSVSLHRGLICFSAVLALSWKLNVTLGLFKTVWIFATPLGKNRKSTKRSGKSSQSRPTQYLGIQGGSTGKQGADKVDVINESRKRCRLSNVFQCIKHPRFFKDRNLSLVCKITSQK